METENDGRPFASHEEKEMLAARLAMTFPQVSYRLNLRNL